MKTLDKQVDIDNPTEVYDYIDKNFRDNGKRITWSYYCMYAKQQGLPTTNLKFDKVKKIPFIPSEGMLEDVIKECRGRKGRNTLRILKTTGCRVGELKTIKFDGVRRVAIIKTEKRRDNAERIVPLPEYFEIPRNWIVDPDSVQRTVKSSTKRLVEKTKNPDYLKIHAHTFRHWYATDLYAKTRDIILVKERLGHTDLQSTLVYIQLVQSGKPKNEVKKVDINDVEAMQELVKSGWEIAVQTAQFIIFKKPMWV